MAGALRLRATEQSFGPVSTGYVVRTQGPRGGAERRGSAVRPEQPAARHYRARSSAGGEARDEASATGADERASPNGRQHGRDAPQTEPPEPAQKRRLLPHGEEAQVLGGLDLRRACACCCDRCQASLSCRYQRASLVAHSTPQRGLTAASCPCAGTSTRCWRRRGWRSSCWDKSGEAPREELQTMTSRSRSRSRSRSLRPSAGHELSGVSGTPPVSEG